MIPGTCVHLVTDAFQQAPGEDAEIVNPGMHGKRLAGFLRERLAERGIDAPSICAEDWGWLVEIGGHPWMMGLCISAAPSADDRIHGYAVVSALADDARWSWLRLRRMPDPARRAAVTALMDAVEAVCREDPRFTRVERLDDVPW